MSRFDPFPETHWTLVSHAGAGDMNLRRKALERLASFYWRPIYAYLRLHWRRSREDALDLTQEFFLKLLGGVLLQTADPTRGKFRAFLKASIDNFVMNHARGERAQRRGGDRLCIPLDAEPDPDRFLEAADSDTPEQILDRHWRSAVLDEALRRLENRYVEEGRSEVFRVFRRYDLAPSDARPTYDELAKEFHLSRNDVDTHLRRARRDLVISIRGVLAESVSDGAMLADEEREFFAGEI